MVSHKRIHGGGARLRMFVPLVQDGRTMYPGYAAVEYQSSTCKFVAVLVMHILISD